MAGDYGRGGVRSWELALRAVALGLTLVAAVVLGTDKQTTTVPFQVSPSLPPLDVPVTAKWHYLSALLYVALSSLTLPYIDSRPISFSLHITGLVRWNEIYRG